MFVFTFATSQFKNVPFMNYYSKKSIILLLLLPISYSFTVQNEIHYEKRLMCIVRLFWNTASNKIFICRDSGNPIFTQLLDLVYYSIFLILDIMTVKIIH